MRNERRQSRANKKVTFLPMPPRRAKSLDMELEQPHTPKEHRRAHLVSNAERADCGQKDNKNIGTDRTSTTLQSSVEATECTSEGVNRLFLSAALHCNMEEVHKQLQRGADPNCKDRDGRPALHIAIYSGDLGIIQGLLELESIDVNCQDIEGCTPLHAAASGDFIPPEYTYVLGILLDRGADVNCKNNNGGTPLHDAAHRGDVHAIDLLLNRGAYINCKDNKGHTPLHDIAAPRGDVRAIKMLLDRGADANCKNNNGGTPLHDAAHRGDVHAINMLLEKGADVNCKDNNERTPLHAAALAGNVFSVIELLLDNGAKMSCKDSNGCTPLHAMTKYLQTSTGNPGKVSTESSVEECLRVIDEVMGALSPGHPAIAMGLKVLEIVKTLPEAHAMGCDFFAGQAGSSGLSGDVSLDQEVECSSMSSTTLSDEESPKAKTRNNTISNAPLTDDLRREISLSSKSCTTFDLSHGDESGSTSENDCEDIDDDANEVEDANEDDEGGNVDNSDYNIEISHNLKGTGTYRYHGGSTSDTKRKGKHIPTKRRRFQSLGDRSNDQEDDESSDQPSKRPKGSKAQGSSPSQSKRPFACPYFKKDPVKYSDCAQWNDTNLRQVKEHCKSRHLKLWCHRCKEFQADTQDEMNIHLRHDDCQMNEESPGSAYSRNDSNSQIRDELDLPRTCTWERVFKVLFHRNTPDPYWEQTAANAVQACDGELSTKIRGCVVIPSGRQPEYQFGLAKNLKDCLGVDEDDVKKVMIAFNADWAAKNCNQVQFSNMDGSGSGSHDIDDVTAADVSSETQSSITPEQIPNNDQSQPTAVTADQHNQSTAFLNGLDSSIPQADQGENPSFIPLCGSYLGPGAATTMVQGYVGYILPNAPDPSMLLEVPDEKMPDEEWFIFDDPNFSPTHDDPGSTTYNQQRNIPS